LYLVRDSELQRLGYALPNSRKRKADDTGKGFQSAEREDLGNMADKFENVTKPMNMQLAFLRQNQATTTT